MKGCFLVLEDGTVFAGQSFGYPPAGVRELNNGASGRDTLPAGEVVFNTGMTGYHEILTDPSYRGQIIVLTYPHIGNYGTDEAWSEYGPEEGEGYSRLKACGLVIRSLYRGPPPLGRENLEGFLKRYRTAGITGVDTRRLTLHIRNRGSLRGLIASSGRKGPLSARELDTCLHYLSIFPNMEGRNLVRDLGARKMYFMNQEGSPHISVIDCGVKANIVQELLGLGCRVSVVPNRITADELLGLRQDGILFSNGPGDPAVLPELVKTAQAVLGQKPILGICLGHQILSLALGARTFKMKFGHHGVNNPVRDEQTGKVQVTSQNHGFAVEEKSLPANCRVRFRNVNDSTIEGISSPALPLLTAQFHPEAAPGPRDSRWIFKSFLQLI